MAFRNMAKLRPKPVEQNGQSEPRETCPDGISNERRGREDISISMTGLLNPEPKNITEDPNPPKEFGFLNISNPSQAGSRENRRYVRKFVRHQAAKNTRPAKNKYRELQSKQSQSDVASDQTQASNPRSRGFSVRPKQKKHKQQTPQQTAFQTYAHPTQQPKPIPFQISTADGTHVVTMAPSLGFQILAWSQRYPKANYAELLCMLNTERLPIRPNLDMKGAMYPIEMDREAHEFVEFMHGPYEITNIMPAFRKIWFGLFLQDAAPFMQLLSTAILHKGFVSGAMNEEKALLYQQRALQSVNERLSDPVRCMGNGIICAVLSFLIVDLIMRDAERYQIDKAGLARIVELRGGIEALDGSPEIRLMILWEDVCGACAFDVKLHYSLPTSHLPPLAKKSLISAPERMISLAWKWNKLRPERHELMTVFHDLYRLNSTIRDGYPKIFLDPWILGMQVNPMVLRLLSPTSETAEPDGIPRGPVERACRLAALLYLADIRIKCMEYHFTGYHFVERLKSAIASQLEEWHEFPTLRLWASVIGGIQASVLDRPLFVAVARMAMDDLSIDTWDQATEIVEGMIWIDQIYGARCQEFGVQVMASYSTLV